MSFHTFMKLGAEIKYFSNENEFYLFHKLNLFSTLNLNPDEPKEVST